MLIKSRLENDDPTPPLRCNIRAKEKIFSQLREGLNFPNAASECGKIYKGDLREKRIPMSFHLGRGFNFCDP